MPARNTALSAAQPALTQRSRTPSVYVVSDRRAKDANAGVAPPSRLSGPDAFGDQRAKSTWVSTGFLIISAAALVALIRRSAPGAVSDLLADVYHYSALPLLAYAAFVPVALVLDRLRQRLGGGRVILGYGIGIGLIVIGHVGLLSSFSWQRVFARVPHSFMDDAPPNVVLLSVDTLRADRLGAYGHPGRLTPNMDRLAAEGTLFEQAVSQSPWTLPSFGSLLTSLYPAQHGAFVINGPQGGIGQGRWAYRGGLRDDVETMAEMLRRRGYATIALQTNWQASAVHNFDQGFDCFLYSELSPHSLWEQTVLGRIVYHLVTRLRPGPDLPFWTKGPAAAEVYQAFEAFVSGDPGRPFFLWINFMDPHGPYRVRKEGDAVGRARVVNALAARIEQIPVRALSRAYDGEVRYVDHYIGKVRNLLAQRGMLDNTLIILLADHGEEFDDHGVRVRYGEHVITGRGHGHSLYEEMLHVPLILRYPPRIPQGVRIATPVRLIDVLPTVLDLIADSSEGTVNGLEGVSLLPLITGKGTSSEGALAFSSRTYFGFEQQAVRDGRFKLIVHPDTGDPPELYDLDEDPEETHNLADLLPQQAERLSEEIARWLERMEPYLRNTTRSPDGPLSREHAERLRALGYLE